MQKNTEEINDFESLYLEEMKLASRAYQAALNDAYRASMAVKEARERLLRAEKRVKEILR